MSVVCKQNYRDRDIAFNIALITLSCFIILFFLKSCLRTSEFGRPSQYKHTACSRVLRTSKTLIEII